MIASIPGPSGCQEKEQGPRLADHKAAHTARYHPAVHRTAENHSPGAAQTRPAATQPGPGARTGGSAALLEGVPFGSGPVGCPVLFVNGDAMTVQEVLEPILDDLALQARTLSESQYRYSFLRTVQEEMDRQIGRLLVYQEAKKNIRDKDQEIVDKEADRILKADVNQRFGGIQARYEEHLRALGFTLADRKEWYKRQVLVMKFMQERFQPLLTDPPRRELLNYYQSHPVEFSYPPKAEMFLIEIPLEKELGKPLAQATVEELAAAQQKARAQLRRAREELDSGVAFTEVAKTYCQGVRRALGGAWEEISPGALTGRWARAAEVLFTLREGQVSDIMETDQMFFLVKCGRRTPERRLTFEQAQARIIDKMRDEQYDRLRRDYIMELLGRATISGKQRQDFLYALMAAAPPPQPPKEQSTNLAK